MAISLKGFCGRVEHAFRRAYGAPSEECGFSRCAMGFVTPAAKARLSHAAFLHAEAVLHPATPPGYTIVCSYTDAN